MMIDYRTPLVMGIVNATPDSFFDGGTHDDAEGAVAHGLRLLDEGADILDVGGESTRPPGTAYGEGFAPVSREEEIRRVLPVIEDIRAARPDARLSVDTMKPEVARLAVEAGASMINDVSAGRFDPAIWRVAALHDVEYVLMHGHDPGNLRQVEDIRYLDVVAEVHAFLEARIEAARSAGVRQVIADVGLGFSKAPGDSARLLREHDRFLDLGVPMLVGPSRKAFIGAILGGLPPSRRLYGTLGAVASAALKGVAIVRVHDVAPARQMLTVIERMLVDTGDARCND